MKLSSATLLCLAAAMGGSASAQVALEKDSVRDCSPTDPCGACQGDCDDDDDCLAGLECFQKNRGQFGGMVPGCDGFDRSRTDYCYAPETEPPLVETEPPIAETEPPVVEETEAPVVEETEAPEAPETEAPETEAPVVDDQPLGFEPGMTTELAGFWMGEERYFWEGDMLSYCSNAFFQTASDGKNWLAWHGAYLGNDTETCADMGVDPLTGAVNNTGFYGVATESYLLDVGYKACLTEAECDYDVTTSEGFEEYDVVAKACGVHLKANLLSGGYDCELYQINRLEKIVGGDAEGSVGVETLDVAVLTYGNNWPTGGFANYTCPLKPSFDLEEQLEDPDFLGTTLFVRQLGYAPYVLPNLTDWECIV